MMKRREALFSLLAAPFVALLPKAAPQSIAVGHQALTATTTGGSSLTGGCNPITSYKSTLGYQPGIGRPATPADGAIRQNPESGMWQVYADGWKDA